MAGRWRTGSILSRTYAPDISRLPARIERGPYRLRGVPLIGFGVLFCGAGLGTMAKQIVRGAFTSGDLLLLLFVGMGAIMLLAGLWLFTFRNRVVISSESAECSHASIFGRKEWTEPLSRYEGVLYRAETRGSEPSYMAHVLWLWHAEGSKRVRLYESPLEDGVRERWMDLCRVLQVPAVEQDGRGLLKRDADDMDKPFAELAAEGKAVVEFDPVSLPPAGVDVRPGLEGLELLLRYRLASLLPIVSLFGLAGVFYYAGQMGAPWYFGYIVLAMVAVGVLSVLSVVFCGPMVVLGGADVRLCTHTPLGATPGRRIPYASIKSVTVARHAQGERVVIYAGDRRYGWGDWIRREQRIWVRDCIRHHLAGRRGGGSR